MAGRDGIGTGPDWTTGSRGLRAGARVETRYDVPRTLDRGGVVLAMASPLVATVLLLVSLAIRG